LDDHPRVTSATSGPQKLTTQDHAPAGSVEGAAARPLIRGVFSLPEEEETVVRAVPAQILALSRVAEGETKTIPVPRELLELSRQDAVPHRAVHRRRDESEMLVWDAWYGSAPFQADDEEPVFELRPTPRGKRSANDSSAQQLSPDALSAEDALWLEALAPTRRVAARAVVLMLATLCAAALYWGIQ
jgi:hypothetical protein